VNIIDRETATGDDVGECVCGAAIAVDVTDHSVMHALPTCDLFDRLGVLDFLKYVRETRERELAGYTKRYGVKA
jgi:hypothetical protein